MRPSPRRSPRRAAAKPSSIAPTISSPTRSPPRQSGCSDGSQAGRQFVTARCSTRSARICGFPLAPPPAVAWHHPAPLIFIAGVTGNCHGRTLATANQIILDEQTAFAEFRRAPVAKTSVPSTCSLPRLASTRRPSARPVMPCLSNRSCWLCSLEQARELEHLRGCCWKTAVVPVMNTYHGWLLDIYPDDRGATLWLLGDDGARRQLASPFPSLLRRRPLSGLRASLALAARPCSRHSLVARPPHRPLRRAARAMLACGMSPPCRPDHPLRPASRPAFPTSTTMMPTSSCPCAGGLLAYFAGSLPCYCSAAACD